MGYAYFKALETHRLTCFPSNQLTTRLNFTLGQSQSFTEHLQHSITSSWPFVHLFLPPSPLLFFPLQQMKFSARAPAVPSPHSASGKRVFYSNLLPSITLYTDTDAPPRLVQREREGKRERSNHNVWACVTFTVHLIILLPVRDRDWQENNFIEHNYYEVMIMLMID